VKRPAFWILLGLVSLAATAVAVHYFPQAFSIVALDITMTRERALADARAIVTRDRMGPADFRQAASFALDSDAQTFVELEGGGKTTFTAMLRDGLYAAYTWRVRHFREGETNETLVRFTPDGRPYGFVETLKEDAPGAALDAAEARRRAEAEAPARWNVDLTPFSLVEQGQEVRPGGRIDHTLIYERSSPVLGDGRYRLRLVMSGDRLTEVTHFVRIPEAFTRRYDSMRSANEAIGIGSLVGMVLLYVVGGIGIGLFFMLRSRYVLWRQAAVWGVIVGGLQALATLNEWPLMWMTYDTAVPRATFIAGRVATLAATLVGFSAFMTLSFMAAESLTRRAFGHHPQFWRVWTKGPGASTTILGQTAAGYLLVAIFFAYDVGLYLVATRVFGWWTPSEALLHPDVLATYVPWLSAIANSLQAGFWEECLFRAVPLAGAALIGDRFGKRGLFLAVAFVVQAVIFGAGHAPYPTQPSFARPVELILPSIGFGLLYVYFGLLPGIVLHFAFDVVWFALPIFLSDAPGIWFQQAMVVLMTFVPLWVVFWRRRQAGAWTSLALSDRNAAWTPPASAEAEEAAPTIVAQGLSARVRSAWLVVGVLAVAGCVWAIAARGRPEMFSIGRAQAADIARAAVTSRSTAGVTLGPNWRVMPVPDDGSGGPREFVSETSGEERRRQLLGQYLPEPRWNVRIATYEGDIAERAEEWRVFVTKAGGVLRVEHTLPEARPGATLDEATARARAAAVLMREFGLGTESSGSAAGGQAREVSARPEKLAARTDWTFTYVDMSLPPLAQGELRIEVDIAGDEVASVRRFVFVPEQWERQQRAAETRNLIVRVISGVVFGGLLVSAAVAGVIAWSRRRYAPRLFFAVAGIMLVVTLASAINGWPATQALMPTEIPLPIQLLGAIGVGLVALIISASLAGLALGAEPARLAGSGSLPERDAILLGAAVGAFGAGLLALASALRTPDWAETASIAPMGAFVPALSAALEPLAGFLTRAAVLLSLLVTIHHVTLGWTRRRVLAGTIVALVGFLGAGAPAGSQLAGWAAAGLVLAAGLLAAYATVLRADLTIVPIALGTMMTIGALTRGAQRAFPGALPGAIVAALLTALLAWWLFRALRRWRQAAVGVAV
jgi:Type II CAAX prenyl endopeptidase Rce1-like